MVIQEVEVDAQVSKHRKPLSSGHPEMLELNDNPADDNSMHSHAVLPKGTLHFLGCSSISLPVSPRRLLIQA